MKNLILIFSVSAFLIGCGDGFKADQIEGSAGSGPDGGLLLYSLEAPTGETVTGCAFGTADELRQLLAETSNARYIGGYDLDQVTDEQLAEECDRVIAQEASAPEIPDDQTVVDPGNIGDEVSPEEACAIIKEYEDQGLVAAVGGIADLNCEELQEPTPLPEPPVENPPVEEPSDIDGGSDSLGNITFG